MTADQNELRLDDLYKMVAYIYTDKNTARTATATFTHFVEVCGMLTIHDRKKKREGIDVTEALCKALGWYFPLLAKMRIRSVEELVFRKFPRVCPYCRLAPHQEAPCKLVRGTSPTVNHEEVSKYFLKNWDRRPRYLDEWQMMFNDIYPRSLEERGRSTIGLLEELGELAEAVRVFEQHPKYFIGEAADIFSYLMGIANEHSIRVAQEGSAFSFQQEFLRRYPGLCIQCGSKICVCPAVPEATVGRMAKEMNICEGENPFIANVGAFSAQGQLVGHKVLDSLGGHAGLSSRLPFDRGDTNRALVALCLRIAEATETANRALAETLRAEALKISVSAQQAGSPRKPIQIDGLLSSLESAWKDLDEDLKSDIRKTEGLVGELGTILGKLRVLFVCCTPIETGHLRGNGELRAIQECVKRSNDDAVSIKNLPSATPTDFRRELLDNKYDFVHFAGHSDGENLIFEDEKGSPSFVPLSAIADAIGRSGTKCVILNACESSKHLTVPIAEFTIGMDDVIEDDAAIEFARGFYDAVVKNLTIENAFQEGLTAVKMAGYESAHIRFLAKNRQSSPVET